MTSVDDVVLVCQSINQLVNVTSLLLYNYSNETHGGVHAIHLPKSLGLIGFGRFMPLCLLVLQGPPPTLEAECHGRHFSRGMREVVASCLNKDPAKRPTAKQLLSKG
jgi:hypothetical protein